MSGFKQSAIIISNIPTTVTPSTGDVSIRYNGDRLKYFNGSSEESFANINDIVSISGDLQTQITSISGSYVPYTGAISDVNLGNNKLLTDAIQLDLTPVASPASTKGQISWNTAEGTTNIGLGDFTLQVGLEDLNLVYNNEGSTVYNGQLVYINAGNNAGNPTVKLARADQEAGSSVFGMATQDISAGGVGYVTSRGKVRDLDTSSFTAGQVLYLSDTVWGGWTAETSGFALSSHRNKIGYVGLSDISAGYVFMDIDNESVDTQISRTEEIISTGLSMSTGVYDYSGMTVATSASFTVPPLKGWIIENTGINAVNPQITNVVFAGGTYPVTNILTDINTYVLISKTGVISQQVTLPTPVQRRDNIYLGKVVHSNKSSINIINPTADYSVSPFSALRDVFTPISILNEGVTPYPNGANLTFNMTAGSLYGLGVNWTVDNKNPNKVTFTGKVPASFNLFTQTAPELFGTTLIQPGFYDVAGVKTAISTSGDFGANRSTNFRIYQFTTGVVGVQYGQTVYSTLASAVAATQTESYKRYPGIPGSAVLVGILSVRRASTNLSSSTQAVFTPASIFGEATGGTAGLSTTTLQQAYDNSTTPEIVTNSTLGAITIRNGSGINTDNIFELQNSSGLNVLTADGLGNLNVYSISGSSRLGISDYAGFLPSAATIHASKNTNTGIVLDTYSNIGAFAGLTLRNARGTNSAATATQSGDTLGFLGASGHTGSAFSTTSRANIYLQASQTWSTSANGTKISFRTTPNGTIVPVERFLLDHDGSVTISNISGASGSIVTHDAAGKLLDSGILATDLASTSTVASISGNFQSQINGKANTAHTHTSVDITDFNEAVYDNVATDGMIVAGSNVTLSYDDINNKLTISAAVDISASGLMNGAYDCDTTNIVYTINHPSVDTNYSVPTTSLLIPTSGSNIFVQGISNRQNTSFQVTLSEVPNVTGYKILWHLPVTSASIIGTAVVNQQMTTLPSTTTSISGNYLVTFTDTILYADNNNTILLPVSPSTNEHHWIVNTYGADITVDGNGKFIWIVGTNNATAILPQDASIHLHYNQTKDKWFII